MNTRRDFLKVIGIVLASAAIPSFAGNPLGDQSITVEKKQWFRIGNRSITCGKLRPYGSSMTAYVHDWSSSGQFLVIDSLDGIPNPSENVYVAEEIVDMIFDFPNSVIKTQEWSMSKCGKYLDWKVTGQEIIEAT